VVFRAELDFQAHKKQKHAKNKSDLRNYSKINIEFNTTNSRDRFQRNAAAAAGGNNNRGGGGGGGGGRYNNNSAANNIDYSDGDDEQYNTARSSNSSYQSQQRRNNNNKNNSNQLSKIQTVEVDVNTLRESREQYERDEQERKRQKNSDKLREQYERYENSINAAASSNSNETARQQSELRTVESPTTAASASQAESVLPSASASQAGAAVVVTQPVNTTWRDLIGSGSMPSMNKEVEFPSLAALGQAIEAKSSALSSSVAAQFLFSGGKKQPVTSAWEKPDANKNAQQQQQQQQQDKSGKAKQQQQAKKNVPILLEDSIMSNMQDLKTLLGKKTAEKQQPPQEIKKEPVAEKKPTPVVVEKSTVEEVKRPVANPPPGFETTPVATSSTLPPPGFGQGKVSFLK
jgi:hypothetical protein